MKKLLLLILLPLFSTQSLGSLDVYDCEVKINNTVYEDITYDRSYDVDSFIIKFDKNKITFSEDSKKRPEIAEYPEFIITDFLDEEKSWENFVHFTTYSKLTVSCENEFIKIYNYCFNIRKNISSIGYCRIYV